MQLRIALAPNKVISAQVIVVLNLNIIKGINKIHKLKLE